MSHTSALKGASAFGRQVTASGADEELFTIDIDTGGTFTDGYLRSSQDTVVTVKTETTPHNFAVGVLECLRAAAAQLGRTLEELLFDTETIRVSTTVGTNALINRNGARVGLLIGEALHSEHAGHLSVELPLDPTMIERVSEAPTESDGPAIAAAVRSLLERGARAIVLALGGTDPGARESTLRDLIAANYPRHYLGAVPVLRSSQVTKAVDPVVRLNTAVTNAYIHPEMSRFLYQLEDQLRELGYQYPLLSATSDNGTSRVAKTTAIRSWSSGPAAGVAAARALAEELRLRHVVTVDIGGTSSDICQVTDLVIPRTVRPRIEGVEVSLPAVDVVSIGIGGGSVARVVDGAVQVGPRSMGGVPGPAAFGLGGDQATLTDALCCLGVFDPENFAGGRKTIDLQRARGVITTHIGVPLAVDALDAAQLVVDRAAERISSAIAALIESSGVALEDWVLFAFGGNGGVLAQAIGARLGVRQAYAFPLSPVFSAFGMSGLDTVHSYEGVLTGDPARTIAELHERAERDMCGEGVVDLSQLVFQFQSEVADAAGMSVVDVDEVTLAVDADERTAAHPELLRMRATAPRRRVPPPLAKGGGAKVVGKRDLRWSGESGATDVADWAAVDRGDVLTGPIVVENNQTTALVPPGSVAIVGLFGEVVFTFLGHPPLRQANPSDESKEEAS